MERERTTGPIEILLIEDNPGDVRLLREALREGTMRARLNVVGDGVAALAFLRRAGTDARVPQPDLILLDLNLPRLNGRDVLAAIKADGALRHIPIIVLTSSADARDVHQAYTLHANCYITKPLDFERFSEVVRAIEQFWLQTVTLSTEWRGAR